MLTHIQLTLETQPLDTLTPSMLTLSTLLPADRGPLQAVWLRRDAGDPRGLEERRRAHHHPGAGRTGAHATCYTRYKLHKLQAVQSQKAPGEL